ncbi:Uncharacterised protein [Enterobacter hormaechei]|nr:Uncharacterised protein [Enterobacter hormaechei]CZV95809.1 Uncharacterised protein [Enterobacter hormaechei]CZX05076.1 Uncharacterised protein [Enterobacter hormaechei]SAB89827.1 Uncharacterised protein [Enterobacter hormaechei]SAI59939.1 Uncharacterised protein [Enterobacter hormaechei]
MDIILIISCILCERQVMVNQVIPIVNSIENYIYIPANLSKRPICIVYPAIKEKYFLLILYVYSVTGLLNVYR